jgi:phosphotransferase system enzyme I (PtsI)
VKTIKGVKISSGVVSGPIFHFDRGKLPVPKHFIREEDFDSELERFNTAIRKSKDELTQVRDLVHNHLDEDHARIIDAQLLAVQDEEMITAVRELMVREKKNVTWAYFEVMDDYEKLLLKTFSQYFKERTVDLKDIKKRVIYHLSHEKDVIQPEILKPSIIVAEKMSPVDLMHIDHKLTLGIITFRRSYPIRKLFWMPIMKRFYWILRMISKHPMNPGSRILGVTGIISSLIKLPIRPRTEFHIIYT